MKLSTCPYCGEEKELWYDGKVIGYACADCADHIKVLGKQAVESLKYP